MKLKNKTAFVSVITVLALLLFLLLPAEAQQQGEEEGDDSYTLTQIELTGNQNVTRKEILDQLGLSEGDTVTEAELKEKVENVKNSGYFREVQSSLETGDGEISLTLELDEYPVLKEIKFEGVSLVGERKLKQGLKDAGIKEGEVINREELDKGLEKVAEKYEEQGYPLISTENVDIGETLTIEVIEGELSSNKFEGLSSVPREVVAEMIETTKGEPIKLRELQLSYQNLQNSAYFESVELVPAQGYSPSDIILRWVLEERELVDKPITAERIHLEGNTVFDDQKLDNLVKRPPEGELTNYDLLRALAPVFREYNSEGYTYADITFQDIENGDAVFDIGEGVITELVIEGNTKTDTQVITNKLFLSEGDVYNEKEMSDSRRRILDLGYFSKAEPKVERTSEGLKLVVTVGEKNRLNSVNGGLTWSEGGLGGRLRLSTKNLFGVGQDLSFNLSREFSLDSKFDGSIDWKNTYYPSGFNFTKLSLYRNVGSNQGFEASFGYPVSGNLSLNLGYNADWIIEEDSSSNSLTNILSADLIYDDRDNPTFPTDGSRRSLKIEKAGDFAPGLSFTQMTFKNSYFQPLPELDIAGERSQVLGLNLQFGLGLDTPANYQSEFVGKNSIRGLGTNLRASNYGFFNSEYRLAALPGQLYLTSFLDGGVDLSGNEGYDFRTSAGFEINLQMFGHLRIGAAWPLSEEFDYVPNFYFGMGPVF
ncbi:MAG: outer membrane protein assembly factor [Candidatus Acetothermia bacterium]